MLRRCAVVIFLLCFAGSNAWGCEGVLELRVNSWDELIRAPQFVEGKWATPKAQNDTELVILIKDSSKKAEHSASKAPATIARRFYAIFPKLKKLTINVHATDPVLAAIRKHYFEKSDKKTIVGNTITSDTALEIVELHDQHLSHDSLRQAIDVSAEEDDFLVGSPHMPPLIPKKETMGDDVIIPSAPPLSAINDTTMLAYDQPDGDGTSTYMMSNSSVRIETPTWYTFQIFCAQAKQDQRKCLGGQIKTVYIQFTDPDELPNYQKDPDGADVHVAAMIGLMHSFFPNLQNLQINRIYNDEYSAGLFQDRLVVQGIMVVAEDLPVNRIPALVPVKWSPQPMISYSGDGFDGFSSPIPYYTGVPSAIPMTDDEALARRLAAAEGRHQDDLMHAFYQGYDGGGHREQVNYQPLFDNMGAPIGAGLYSLPVVRYGAVALVGVATIYAGYRVYCWAKSRPDQANKPKRHTVYAQE